MPSSTIPTCLLVSRSLTAAERQAFREEWKALHAAGNLWDVSVLQTTGGVFLDDETIAGVTTHDAKQGIMKCPAQR